MKKRATKNEGGNKRRTRTKHDKVKAFMVRAPEPLLRWVDRTAVEGGMSRNQFIVLVLRSTEAYFEASRETGLFKGMEQAAERAVHVAMADFASILAPGSVVK